MNSLTTTLEAGRDAVMRRTRQRGARWLDRAQQGIATVEDLLALRRKTTAGRRTESALEQRVIGGLEVLLDHLSLRLRSQHRRLSRPEPGGEEHEDVLPPVLSPAHASAPPPPSSPEPAQPRTTTATTRPRVSALAEPRAAVARSGRATPARRGVEDEKTTQRAEEKAPRSARGEARGPSESGALGAAELETRSAKELVKLIPTLTPGARSALRAHEKANKKRKTVLAALDAS